MEKMKRISSRLVKTLLAAAMFVMLIGVTASAADEKVVLQKNESGAYVYVGEYDNYDTNVYHQISVPSSGALVISGNAIWPSLGSTGALKVELYSSKMKRLDNSSYGQWVDATESEIAVYGVKKGTYYIKVSGYKNYVVSAAVQKTTNKGGTSKKKAYTIKKQKKAMLGVMPAGEKSSATDWYKFKVTKKRILQLKLEAANNGAFDFWLYGPSYKKGIKIDSLENESGTYYSINSRTKKKLKISTGTYYIKVKRNSYDPKASGIYSITWRLK